jgi:putative ABC transport system ATP-binding protein
MIYAGFSKSERKQELPKYSNKWTLPIEWITNPTNFLEDNASVAIACFKQTFYHPCRWAYWKFRQQNLVRNHETFETSNGNTVILVTHEEEIAAYAHRVIRLRDGLIESDTTK